MGRPRVSMKPGDRYGHMVIIEELDSQMISERVRRFFRFKCDCGNITVKSIHAVRNCRTVTCSYKCPYRFENTDWYKKRMAEQDGSST